MVNVSHASSPIRRPPSTGEVQEEDHIMDPNEQALLDEFYNDTTPLHQNLVVAGRQSSSINPLIEEFDFDNHDNHNSFRRRRVDGNITIGSTSHERDSLLRNANTTLQQKQQQQQQNNHYTTSNKSKHVTWNRLNVSLFIGQALLSSATTVPITLVPTMALSLAKSNENETWDYSPYYNMEILEVYDENGTRKRWIPFRIRTNRNSNNNNNNQQQNYSSSSIFASHLTSTVTLVTAFGKFINGPLVDVAGARRLLLIYGTCTSLALMGLRYSSTPGWAIGCCAAVEFFSSINWPAGIVRSLVCVMLLLCVPFSHPHMISMFYFLTKVILGAHYGMNGNNESNGRFERGLYVTSLACRCGSLLAIPLSSLLIKWTGLTWRGVAGLASCASFLGVVVFYLYLTDSPGKVHDPQNPIRTKPQSNNSSNNVPSARHNAYHPSFHTWSTPQQSMYEKAKMFCSSVFYTVLPSIKAILSSRVFWVIAIAHAGATMVKSSDRILGTYFRDTSFGVVTESKAGAMTVFLSLGMLGGLLVGGKAFVKAADSEQGRHNTLNNPESHSLTDAVQVGTKNMIAFFYCLSICSCYMLSFLAMPFVRRALHLPVLVLILQVLTTLGLGFGVAVQYYHIPAIVGATYGQNRGLYTAYTDGVAALVSSIVWRIVGGAVEEGNPQGGGWAYGWAAVALLLVFCGTLMIKMVELYFVGGGWHHEAVHAPEDHDEMEPLIDLNTSWLDDEIQSIDTSKPHDLNILSTSALEFIGSSPGRIRKSLLSTVDSRDEEDTTVAGGQEADILGIDDDGSLLFPTSKEAGPQQHGLVSFNSMFESPEKEIHNETDSEIRATSTFSDAYDDQYNRGIHNSFEL